MESTGTTLVGQFFDQERIVRDAPSANSWAREIHRVKTSGAGAATLYTRMDRIVAVLTGIDGTTAGNAPAVDCDGGVYDPVTELYAVPVAGANNTEYCVMIVGNFEGK